MFQLTTTGFAEMIIGRSGPRRVAGFRAAIITPPWLEVEKQAGAAQALAHRLVENTKAAAADMRCALG